ncbi:myosin, N-terminal, SH3 domain protein [Richelia sinica FACHB-800]|uniref:Myosin, N-terminal, SH3 domain protein n=1 Tax=Richelia sinica FACHB-800 TaxID=1357546 RepID=A0A975T9A0_9NOST|nr:hypothetical protein [Richelia sinica]MBD2663345.1 hypothetical protein [Richelia sinica FACHB-800]QXE24517.1 myosin, N-terminal, SH3 domain protein [Richelia sinica FACHB-800]
MTTENKGSFYYALDEEGNKIPPTPKVKATCPCCGTEVYAACGKIIQHHWRHKNTSDSHCDEWYEMTPWHLKWQELFPLECREVVMQKNKEIHRADVKIGNLIIEFQHSNLSNENVRERELFYSSDANKIIWIIDATNNRVFEQWKKYLCPENIRTIFIVDKESNIYFELEGYVYIPLIRNIGKKGLPIGLVINPEYPTFIDLGEYIACPLEKITYEMTRTMYSHKWGHRKQLSKKELLEYEYLEDDYKRGFIYAQDFILVKKNDFVKIIYDIPTDLDYFTSIKICDQEVLNRRKYFKEERKKFLTEMMKKHEEYASHTMDEMEEMYMEQIVVVEQRGKKKMEEHLRRFFLYVLDEG